MRSKAMTAVIALTLAALAGCAEETRHVPGEAKTPAKPKAEPEDTFIVGKRTQEIGDADDPALKQGAVVASQRIVAKDPITVSGNAYVSMIGRTSILSIDKAMGLYQATNDRYPSSHEEFMSEIIRANNIALPKLPFYQEYVYDVQQHKLLIYEYPEKKAGPLPGQAR
ncbi:MAG: hypothetical protein AB7I30_18120 [Isosphaeraceae bacterium]